MYSITKYGRPFAVAPASKIWAMFGWSIIATAWRSLWKRDSTCQVVSAEPGDTYAKITQIHTITGGTGRFAGVQGSFTLALYHDVVARDGTHGTCGSYSGTITP